METCSISFDALLVRTEMRMVSGSFDENLDGGEWCLTEYVRRVAALGYKTCIAGRLRLSCSAGQQFGSAQRRIELEQNSRTAYLSRWGIARHYCIYFGPEADAVAVDDTVAAILDGARRGHRFTLLLHRRQFAAFRKMGWNGLHTGITLHRISLLFPQRDLQKMIAALRAASPDLLAVRGCSGVVFPGVDAAISLQELLDSIQTPVAVAAKQQEETLP
jgi:hypothetical protein